MKLPSRALVGLAGWTVAGYGTVQALRLLGNIVLARLLAPELFGIMLLVNTMRTGIELFSDVGLGQNIVSNRRGEEPAFYNTAWTIQVIRGVVLGLVCLLAAGPVSDFYGEDVLFPVLAAASLLFVVAGLESTGRYLVQKRVDARRFAFFDVATTAVAVSASIAFALISPTIWALVGGAVAGSLALLIGSWSLIPGLRHRLTLERTAVREILTFGKWVFLSSVIYFLAMNFDRLYMAKTLSFGILGVYGVARSLSDILSLLAARFGTVLIFPLVANAAGDPADLRRRLIGKRSLFLLAAAAGVAAFASVCDVLVYLLYDERYRAAAAMLPVLAIGVWFAILGTVNESVLLGIGRPAYAAYGNLLKLGWLLVGLPMAVPRFGVSGAVCVIAAAELLRYPPVWLALRRESLSFARTDGLITLALLGMIVVGRAMLHALELTPSLEALWTIPSALVGAASAR